MKASMIIGKKQIVLAALVLILAAGVYVNWIFSEPNAESYDITAELSEDEEASAELSGTSGPEEDESAEKEKILGEPALVDSRSVAAEDYFALASIAKMQARDEAIDTISIVLEDENADSESRAAASSQAMSLSQTIETETSLENLIRSRGFDDCMVYLKEDHANVVVKCAEMDGVKATQIKELVLTESNIPAENISIIDLK